jgi:DNA polymerase-3 subunit alpha
VAKAKQQEPEIEQLCRNNLQYRQLLDVAERLEGTVHDIGVHGAGVAVSDGPVAGRIPLFPVTGTSTPATQYAAEYLHESGVTIVDVLGLRALSVTSHASRLICRSNPAFAVSDIPLDDEPTFRLLSDGQTLGVFQFESDGVRSLLRRLEPSNLLELCAVSALYRPAMIEDWEAFAHRDRAKEIRRGTPGLAVGALDETRGIMLYQEQFMQAVNYISGFPLGKADAMRRALLLSDDATVEEWRSDFVDAALKNGFADKHAEEIFNHLLCVCPRLMLKAHVLAYVTIGYQCAYLKANHPTEFFAGLLHAYRDDAVCALNYAREAARLGIEVEYRCSE